MNTTAHLARNSRGFTLVELLIAVAIVGILASIAVPSYRSYVIRGNRADAQKALMAASQAMERYFIGRNNYLVCGTSPGSCTLPTSVALNQSPESGTAIYNIGATVTATTYTLRATPVGSSTNGRDGFLEINNTGQKSWDRDNSGTIASGTENNWNR